MLRNNALSAEKKAFRQGAWVVLLSLLAVYALLWALTPDKPWQTSTYHSYLLQALRWLDGHLDLGQNYSYLEIARYGGKFYISFPPIPSVLLLPFAVFFGENTPDHLIAVMVGMVGALFALRMGLSFGLSLRSSVFWALFTTLGSNFLHVGYRADVWYFAQTCAFTLTMMSLYYASFSKEAQGWLPLFLLALAVGCRPLNMVCLPLILLLLWQKYGMSLFARRHLWWWLPPLIAGGFLMLLNVLRFGNPMEFGHNYLPEFAQESPNGQFWSGYIPQNLKQMFRLPAYQNGRLDFPIFNGVALWMVSPIFLIWAFLFFKVLPEEWKNPAFWCALLLPLLHLVLLCSHKTLGGWQFGNRYTVDLLPLILWGVLSLLSKEKYLYLTPAIPLFLWGMGLNLAGTIALMNGWLS